MAVKKEVEVQQKQELETKQESTKVDRHYLPHTDIHESADAIIVEMEMPGVEKKNVTINLEKNVLSVTGDVDLAKYEGVEPLYAEYNVGHYARSFTVSTEIDSEAISAAVADGVLTVTLPKRKEAAARQITVQ